MLIKNNVTNAQFLKVIEVLMGNDPEPESKEGQALTFLVNEVKQFEDQEYGN